MNLGLLLTITEPRAEDEAEFNAWYDSEHILERLSIPGFLSARRWQADARPGEGKYLATYELVSPYVLDSEEYKKHIGENATPWTKRALGNCVVFRRWACEQILPGDTLPPILSHALFFACGDVPPEHEAEFNAWYDDEHVPLLSQVPGVMRARRFKASSGAPRYLALYDLADDRVPEHPQWRAAIATEWSKRIDRYTAGREWILRCYRAYARR